MLESYSKKCIYSAIIGDYDNVREINNKLPEFDYILFTNNKELKSKTWDIVYIENEDNLDNIRLARQIKLEYYKYIPDYDFSIWIDGYIHLHGDIYTFLKDLPLDLSDIFVSKHPHRNTVYEECDACLQLKKDTPENINNQKTSYQKQGVPANVPLIESGVLVRKDSMKMRKFCKLWFEEICKYTPRDQIAFSYVFWKNPMSLYLFKPFRDNYKHVFTLGVHNRK